ncbi:MAG: endonuclease/exonuclease/phosphatase family protein [Sedimentisphaerales bacterium]|nr:endonuclease/exonuclease/phosphatase family protein [Sedimentisphaerales bacterium]
MRILGLILAAVLSLGATSGCGGGELEVRVMSFNIRYGSAADGENRWDKRKELVYEVIRKEDGDFVGLQEALDFQLEAIKKNVAGYEHVGIGREVGGKGEYSAILYRSKRFGVLESGTFWLSDTPEKVSKGWGNNIVRICTWGRFIEKKTGKCVYVYNTHLDHESQVSREKSARLLMERIGKRRYADPFMLTGDFNAGENNPAILYLKGKKSGEDKSKTEGEVTGEGSEEKGEVNPKPVVDSFRVLHGKAKKVGTFNGFKGVSDGDKIDFIFVEPGIKVLEAQIVRTHKENRYPSDHFPITARLRFNIKASAAKEALEQLNESDKDYAKK